MSTLQRTAENLQVREFALTNILYWKNLLNWTSTSLTLLSAVEEKILHFLQTPYRTFYVNIGAIVGNNDRIWTIALNTKEQEVPLVMLHGLGAGLALWVLNLDSLSECRPVYALDILGFGRSSRPTFSNDSEICEKQFVKSIEEWRKKMHINEMILLGHSMGGYLASSYALSYPERVKHLILADPWGFPEKSTISGAKRQFPLWVRALAYLFTPFNPLFIIRAAGPFGKWLVQKIRPDICLKFAAAVENDSNIIPHYIHQCNSRKPSGESAFHSMLDFLGCAKHPMIKRIYNLPDHIPMTFIYGSCSWIDPNPGKAIRSGRKNSYVDIKNVFDAGHHVYADNPEIFNSFVNDICTLYKLRKSTMNICHSNTFENCQEDTLAPSQKGPDNIII